jgi:hypothetical protein
MYVLNPDFYHGVLPVMGSSERITFGFFLGWQSNQHADILTRWA